MSTTMTHAMSTPATGIYLISPSGAVADPQSLGLARERLAGLGFNLFFHTLARAFLVGTFER